MSSTEHVNEVDEVCASCGITAGDDVTLKICTACKLVKYCSVDCQKNHRPQHKKACKKRLAELRDDKLFTQPDESHLGECPICCLPNPLGKSKSGLYTCCGKRVCNGCAYFNMLREEEQGLEQRCPYCREPMPKTDEGIVQYTMKRVKANDPVALRQLGQKCYKEGDYEGAFEYFTKAAELGDVDAHNNLSNMYRKGEGVEKDMKKSIYHMEEAAIGGHPVASYNLGCIEESKGRMERAVKHYIIAANLGDDGALKRLRELHSIVVAKKEDFEVALRGHQAAVDATKSEQRDAADRDKYLLSMGYNCFAREE